MPWALLFFIFLIGGLILNQIGNTKWGARHIFQREKHLTAQQLKQPYMIVTRQLPAAELSKHIHTHLPDTTTNQGDICLIEAKGNGLHFAILGSLWVGGLAGQIRLPDGTTRSTLARFIVVVHHSNQGTTATLNTVRWTERAGVMKYPQYLVRARDKLLSVIQSVDHEAYVYEPNNNTEGGQTA